MSPDALVLTDLRDGVLSITLNDPARRNPISMPMREQLIAVLEAAHDAREVLAVTFHGAGRCFSAGGDLATMPPDSIDDSIDRMNRIEHLIRLIIECPKPTTAGIDGAAAGMSVGLAAACDYVVAGEGAQFLLPFSRLGLVPDGGILASLSARVGSARAKRLLLLGNPLGAVDALALGLADVVTSAGSAPERARQMAGMIAQRAPLAVAAIKQAFRHADVDAAFRVEREGQPALFFSADFQEGKRAFFERREPSFTGS